MGCTSSPQSRLSISGHFSLCSLPSSRFGYLRSGNGYCILRAPPSIVSDRSLRASALIISLTRCHVPAPNRSCMLTVNACHFSTVESGEISTSAILASILTIHRLLHLRGTPKYLRNAPPSSQLRLSESYEALRLKTTQLRVRRTTAGICQRFDPHWVSTKVRNLLKSFPWRVNTPGLEINDHSGVVLYSNSQSSFSAQTCQ